MTKYAKRAKHATRSFTKCSSKAKRKIQYPAHANGEVVLPSMMRERTRKIAASAAALAIVGALAAPMPAWAADWVYIDGNDYDQAASGAGSGGGSWSWDGADDLLLDNYSGTGIEAGGDLDITLEGENEIYYTEDEYGGIYVEDGDLTITGDGSLDVTDDDYAAIEVTNGDLTIEETTVKATTDIYNDGYDGGAITVQNGSIDIIGSEVDATWNETDDGRTLAHAIVATNEDASRANAGTIDIVYSDVTATVLTPNRSGDWSEYTCAIGAYSYDWNSAPLINIDSSTVDASTPGGLALLANNWEGGIPGTINIFNATMPAGVSVQNTAYGQTLGTSPSPNDVSSSVHIESTFVPVDPTDPANPAESDEPAVSPFTPTKAYAATSDAAVMDDASPATGDSPAGIFATIAAAITAAGAALFGRKKMKSLKK